MFISANYLIINKPPCDPKEMDVSIFNEFTAAVEVEVVIKAGTSSDIKYGAKL